MIGFTIVFLLTPLPTQYVYIYFFDTTRELKERGLWGEKLSTLLRSRDDSDQNDTGWGAKNICDWSRKSKILRSVCVRTWEAIKNKFWDEGTSKTFCEVKEARKSHALRRCINETPGTGRSTQTEADGRGGRGLSGAEGGGDWLDSRGSS